MTRQGTWTDREGRAVTVPEPPAAGSYYGPIGDFQGTAYERNAFARGTAQEVEFLVTALDLVPGTRVLDVGCGTARHARALAERGLEPVGVDVSHGLLAAGHALGGPVRLAQADARALPLHDASADAVLCLCQGGFGITPGGDEAVLAEIARVLRPGGRLALTAFSAWFAARFAAPEDAIDVARGLVYTRAEVRGRDEARAEYDLWTTCYTPGHLQGLLDRTGLELEEVSGVEPGQYRHHAPTITDPELLLLARKRRG